MTPKSFRVAPKSFRVIPEDSRAAPRYFGAIPKDFRVAPDYFRVIPKDFRRFMAARALTRMREKVRRRLYLMTTHAEEEMDNDGLTIFDVESVMVYGD